jgi:starch synthase
MFFQLILKAGLLSADRVNTVSPSYAREIRTAERGMGMEGTIRLRGDDVIGIVNGIDNLSWDPATDPLLDTRYDAEHLEHREPCRAALRAELRLEPGDPRPLLGFVGRVTKTKGVDLLLKATARIVDHLTTAASETAAREEVPT